MPVCGPTSLFPALATSSVEELAGIFSRECKLSRNNAQQLNDVGYMVYRGEEGQKETGAEEKEMTKEGGEQE